MVVSAPEFISFPSVNLIKKRMNINCITGTFETISFEATYVVPQISATSNKEMAAVQRDRQTFIPIETKNECFFLLLNGEDPNRFFLTKIHCVPPFFDNHK
jgi:hypothetical protein